MRTATTCRVVHGSSDRQYVGSNFWVSSGGPFGPPGIGPRWRKSTTCPPWGPTGDMSPVEGVPGPQLITWSPQGKGDQQPQRHGYRGEQHRPVLAACRLPRHFKLVAFVDPACHALHVVTLPQSPSEVGHSLNQGGGQVAHLGQLRGSQDLQPPQGEPGASPVAPELSHQGTLLKLPSPRAILALGKKSMAWGHNRKEALEIDHFRDIYLQPWTAARRAGLVSLFDPAPHPQNRARCHPQVGGWTGSGR